MSEIPGRPDASQELPIPPDLPGAAPEVSPVAAGLPEASAPIQPLPEQLSDKKSSVVLKVVAIAALSASIPTAAFGSTLAIGDMIRGHGTPNAAAAAAPVTCKDSGLSYGRLGAHILSQPQDPHIRYISNAPIPYLKDVNVHSARGQRIYTIATQNVLQRTRDFEAAKEGVTVHDPRPYEKGLVDTPIVDDLLETGGTLKDKPFSAFFNASKKFLALYGVKLSISSKDFSYADNGRRPQESDLETTVAKRDVFGLLAAFAAEPVQYPEGMGLKRVVLEAGTKSTATAYSTGNMIVEDIDYDFDPSPVLWHEEGHHVDSLTCADGTADDPTFTALNEGAPYHGEAKPVAATEYPAYDSRANNLWSDMTGAIYHEDRGQVCRDSDGIRALGERVVFISDYAGTDEQEDKAELLAHVPDYNSETTTMDPYTPRVDRKYALVFGRLAAAMPRVARYFAGVATPPAPNPAEHCPPTGRP